MTTDNNRSSSFLVTHWREFLSKSSVFVASIWTIIEIYNGLTTDTTFSDMRSHTLLAAVIVLSAFIGACVVWRSVSGVSFKLRGIETNLKISFGDVLDGNDGLVVPVNEYFDHVLQVGTEAAPVSPRSVHGQVVEQIGEEDFRSAADESLSSLVATATSEERLIEPKLAYPLGTVANIEVNGRQNYLVAVAKTDNDDGYRAKMSLPDLFPALAKAWHTISNTNAQTVRLPLIGSGFGSTQVDHEHLLEILIASIFEYSRRERPVAPNVEIVLLESLRGRIRCYNVKAEWS